MFNTAIIFVFFLTLGITAGGQVTKALDDRVIITSDVTENNVTCPQHCSCSWYNNDNASLLQINCTFDQETEANEATSSSSRLSLFFKAASSSYLESLELTGCSSLTNLSSLTIPYSLINLKLSHGGLQFLEDTALAQVGSKIQTLDLAHNKISTLPPGFFESLTSLKILDLSGNDFIELNFALIPTNVKQVYLDDSTFLESVICPKNEDHKSQQWGGLETLSVKGNPNLDQFCPWIIWSSPKLRKLDLSSCPMLKLPHRAFKANPDLVEIKIDKVICDCSPPLDIFDQCFDGATKVFVDRFRRNNCLSNAEINQTSTDVLVWQSLVLDCHNSLEGFDRYMWITPLGHVHSQDEVDNVDCPRRDRIVGDKCVESTSRLYLLNNQIEVLGNGSLSISDLGWSDRGLYECVAYDKLGQFESVYAEVILEDDYRANLYYLSLVYGFATAGGFLLITLFVKLIHFVLHNYGCCLFCCCCKNRLPPKARRLKTAMESIEAYRGQQQDKLRENYAQQSEWIRQNCAVQMERVRENYNWQVQNLRDIRLHGSNQVTAVRDQYYDQMARIRDFSTNQLERVHENYIFQRQRLRKFSAQNYLKMRETRQYTSRTLHKVMENLPALYLDLTACRQGLGERQPSIEWDIHADSSQILELERFHQKRMQQIQFGERRSDSLYFTPSSTPMRDVGDMSQQHPPSASKPSPPYNDTDAYRAIYGHQSYNGRTKGHGRVRSFSHFLPGWFPGAASVAASSTCNNEKVVEAVVEHYNDSANDYYDMDQPHEADQLLTSVIDNDSGEIKIVVLTASSEDSPQNLSSGSAKKSFSISSSTATGSSPSKKTVMTNLSGMKSDFDLCVQLLPHDVEAATKLKQKRLSL